MQEFIERIKGYVYLDPTCTVIWLVRLKYISIYLEYFIFGDIGLISIGSNGSEGALNLRQGLDVLCLTADHEQHVVFQCYVTVSETTSHAHHHKNYYSKAY